MVKRKRKPGDVIRSIVRRAVVHTHNVDPRQPLSRETWILGKYPHPDYDIDVRLDHGVGSGHAQLSLMVDIDGKRVAWEYIDMTTLVNHWAQKIVEEDLRRRAATGTP